jgi:hypothetical protein
MTGAIFILIKTDEALKKVKDYNEIFFTRPRS